MKKTIATLAALVAILMLVSCPQKAGPTPPEPPKPKTYTVTFNSNEGKGEMAPQIFTENVPQAINKCMFTKEGYTFKHWDSNEGNRYADQEIIAVSKDIDLYAQWDEIKTLVDYELKLSSNQNDNIHSVSIMVFTIFDNGSKELLEPSKYSVADNGYTLTGGEYVKTYPKYDYAQQITIDWQITIGSIIKTDTITIHIESEYTEYISERTLNVSYNTPKQVGDIFYNFEYIETITNNKNSNVYTRTYTTIDELNNNGIGHNLVDHEWYMPYSSDELEYSRTFTVNGISKEINITMPLPIFIPDVTSMIVQCDRFNQSYDYQDYKITMEADIYVGSTLLYEKYLLDKLPSNCELKSTTYRKDGKISFLVLHGQYPFEYGYQRVLHTVFSSFEHYDFMYFDFELTYVNLDGSTKTAWSKTFCTSPYKSNNEVYYWEHGSTIKLHSNGITE